MEIDNQILKRTTQCDKSFVCQHDPNNCYCLSLKVERCVEGKIIFINCVNSLCKYYLSFGRAIICNCPTRIGIYLKYNR